MDIINKCVEGKLLMVGLGYINKFFILLLFVIAIFNFPDDAISKDKELLFAIKGDTFLESGNVEFVTLNNNKRYCVSVGSSQIHGSSPEAKIKAIKEARMKAESQLMKFIYSTQNMSYDSMTTQTVIRQTGNGVPTRDEREVMYEFVRDRGKGLLKNLTTIGKWKSKDKTEYYVGIGMQL